MSENLNSYSDEWKRKHVFDHPMFDTSKAAALWTPPVSELYAEVSRCLLVRRSGYIEEVTGKGKSCAKELILEQLRHDFNSLICVQFVAQTNRVPSVRAFFKELLTALHIDNTRGETWDLRNRVRHRLEELALSSGCTVVILWIDEAQALVKEEFLFLRDVQNGLRDIGVELIVFLSGESPFLSRHMGEASWEYSHAVQGRFGMKRLVLKGYGVDDIAALFDLFDQSIWPLGSDITWTQFFLPKAYGANFRLLSEVDAFMSAFAEEKLLDGTRRCSPRLIRDVLSRFFLDLVEHDAPELVIEPGRWHDAINDAINKDAVDNTEAEDDE
jgi:hypothetical protein